MKFVRIVKPSSVCLGAAYLYWAVCALTHAQSGADVKAQKLELPPSVSAALERAKVPLDSVAIVVREASGAEPLIDLNAKRAMNPASLMKLVTTFAALDTLGPGYTWRTEVLASAEVKAGVLKGDLILRGSGDPKLTVERMWLLVRQLRERGLRSIEGDLVLDKSSFGDLTTANTFFDSEIYRAYNVGPDALLTAGRTVRFQFAPGFDGKSVVVGPDVRPFLGGAPLTVVNKLKLTETACGDWRARIRLDASVGKGVGGSVTFSGAYPRSCGERAWSVPLLDHGAHTAGVFARLWSEFGGEWKGSVRTQFTPVEAAVTLASVDSPPLGDIVRDINKYSNNVMARQVLLTLGAVREAKSGEPILTTATEAVKASLSRRGVASEGLVIENGSGLSRLERVSANSLAQVLVAAFRAPFMPEFMSSLSLAGVDGTYRRRASGAAGQAHLKSGTLNDVSATAGYLLDAKGRRMVLVFIINHPHAVFAQAAQDELLNWLTARP